MFIGGGFQDDDVPQEKDSRQSRRRDRRRENRKKTVSYADAARPKDDDRSHVPKIPGVHLNKSNPTGVDEKLLCVHCGSNDHDLPDCHLITDEELGQILVQLKADKIQDSAEGNIILQSEKTDKTLAKAKSVGGLLRSRLYLDTCTTNDQMTTREYLTDIHQAPKSLKMHTNSGSSLRRFKGKLGVLHN